MRRLALSCALVLLLTHCDEGAPGDRAPCFSNADCMDGHECLLKAGDGPLEPGDDDADRAIGYCSEECDDALCPYARTECSGRFGYCTDFDCGRTLACLGDDKVMYCDTTAHTCHAKSGECGGGLACPRLTGQLPPNRSIECRLGAANLPGVCAFEEPGYAAPPLTGSPPQDIAVASPPQTHVFALDEEPTFTYEGVLPAHFLVVSTERPRSEAELWSNAIWGIALPKSPDVEHTVVWSSGQAIVRGEWRDETTSPPVDRDLWLMVLAVEGDRIVRTSRDLLAFRVGTPWPFPGDACERTSDGWPCLHPTIPMVCRQSQCRQLCLTFDACPADQTCELEVGTGVRYCR